MTVSETRWNYWCPTQGWWGDDPRRGRWIISLLRKNCCFSSDLMMFNGLQYCTRKPLLTWAYLCCVLEDTVIVRDCFLLCAIGTVSQGNGVTLP